MIEAAENLYVLNADEQAMARARARQEAVIHEKAMQQRQADLERQKADLERQKADLERQLAKRDSEFRVQTAAIASLRAELEQYRTTD